MELSKKSELTLGTVSYVIHTALASDDSPSIRTEVVAVDGSVVFETSQDISALSPIFQNSQKVFAQMEAQHQNVVKELKQGRLNETGEIRPPVRSFDSSDHETDALEHAVSLLRGGNFEKAAAALRAVLETYPNCSEARELLEVTYKASSGTRLPVDLVQALKRGTEAYAGGRQRDAIESWKQCLIEEPGNRLLQLLVMLATTWSPERRQRYANEVLAAGSEALSAGRPEEAQALLLIAQTVEGASRVEEPPAAPTPQPAADPPPPPAPPAVAEPAASFEDPGSGLESLVPDVPDVPEGPETPQSEDTFIITDDAPFGPLAETSSPPVEATSPPAPSPAPLPQPAPAPPPVAAQPAPAPPAVPPREVAPTAPMTFGEPEVEVPPASANASQSSISRAPARPAHARRPVGRAKSKSVPWVPIGAGVAALVLIGVGAFWLMSGDNNVPPNRLDQAASLVGSGQYAQAISSYDGLLGEFGDHASIYLGRGRAKIASGDTDGGLSDLKRARDIDPSTSAIAEEIGDVYYSRGSYPEAIEYYREAFANSPGSPEARYRIAVSLVQRDERDAAMEHLKAAITSDPRHGEAQFLYGTLLNQRGQFAEAEQALRASESHVEAGGDYLAELAISLLGQEKLDDAEEVARTFIRNYPSDARGPSVLGEVYLNRRQYEQARAELIRALMTDRNEPRAQIALGRTWLAIGKTRGDQGDLAKARQVLTSAQGVHEGNRLLALGQVALAEGDLVSSQRLLLQSLDHGAAELPVRLSLAEAKALGEDLVGAAEEMQRASGFAPEDPAIALSLAIAYSQLTEADRATEHFLKTIQGIGLMAPPGQDAGPVMLPAPYIPLPQRFDVNRAIRNAYTQVLGQREDDPSATELKVLAESTQFVLGTS